MILVEKGRIQLGQIPEWAHESREMHGWKEVWHRGSAIWLRRTFYDFGEVNRIQLGDFQWSRLHWERIWNAGRVISSRRTRDLEWRNLRPKCVYSVSVSLIRTAHPSLQDRKTEQASPPESERYSFSAYSQSVQILFEVGRSVELRMKLSLISKRLHYWASDFVEISSASLADNYSRWSSELNQDRAGMLHKKASHSAGQLICRQSNWNCAVPSHNAKHFSLSAPTHQYFHFLPFFGIFPRLFRSLLFIKRNMYDSYAEET